MTRTIAALLVLALAACATWTPAASPDPALAADHECRSYGLERGSDGYGICRAEIATRERLLLEMEMERAREAGRTGDFSRL